MKKMIVIFLLAVATIIIVSLLLVRTCSLQTGWNVGVQKSCECSGIEWTLYNQLPVDGDMKTVCIGVIKSVECYEYKNNEKVEVNCQ